MTTLAPIEAAKRLAAYAAVDRHVKPEHKVIGIGSGSTVPFVVDRIREKGGNEGRVFVPTGEFRGCRGGVILSGKWSMFMRAGMRWDGSTYDSRDVCPWQFREDDPDLRKLSIRPWARALRMTHLR